MKTISIEKIVKKFELEILAGSNGWNHEVYSNDIHRPGLEFTGFLEYFPAERIQVLGRQEMTYLQTLENKVVRSRFEKIVDLSPPCFILTRGQDTLSYFEEHCEKYNIPLLRTPEKTTTFMAKLSNFLDVSLAEEISIHGVCMNVAGIGVLLKGQSGIGKSETALSLVAKGHRLVTDDSVILKKIGVNTIIGTFNEISREMLSLRGIGVVNIARLYGASSFQEQTRIVLVISLDHWDEDKYYNPLFMEESYEELLGVPIRHIHIPVRPGRDIATLIEVAVNNYKLQQKGYNAFDVMQDRMTKAMENQQ